MPTALIEKVQHNGRFSKKLGYSNLGRSYNRNPEVVVIVNYGKVTAEQKEKFMILALQI